MSAAGEHLATRRAAGLFDFSFMGLSEFNDLASIQSVQTRNVENLEPGQIAYTLLLREDGAVLIDAIRSGGCRARRRCSRRRTLNSHP